MKNPFNYITPNLPGGVPNCEIEIFAETELSYVNAYRDYRGSDVKPFKEGMKKAVIQEAKKAFRCIDCDCFAHSIYLVIYEPAEEYDTRRQRTLNVLRDRHFGFYSCSNEKCDWHIPISVSRFRFDFSKIQGEPREYLEQVFDSHLRMARCDFLPANWKLKLWNKYHKTSKSQRKKRIEFRKNPPTYDPIGMLEL